MIGYKMKFFFYLFIHFENSAKKKCANIYHHIIKHNRNSGKIQGKNLGFADLPTTVAKVMIV